MNEVQLAVDVGFENNDQLKKRMNNANNSPPELSPPQIKDVKKYAKEPMVKIEEEDNDSDDLNLILKKADEVLEKQDEMNGQVMDTF